MITQHHLLDWKKRGFTVTIFTMYFPSSNYKFIMSSSSSIMLRLIPLRSVIDTIDITSMRVSYFSKIHLTDFNSFPSFRSYFESSNLVKKLISVVLLSFSRVRLLKIRYICNTKQIYFNSGCGYTNTTYKYI